MIDFYGYDGCDTCRKAKKWLDARGVAYRSIAIVERPPSKALLKKLMKGGGYELKQLFNTSGQVYRQMKIKDKLGAMSVEEAVEAEAADTPYSSDIRTAELNHRANSDAKHAPKAKLERPSKGNSGARSRA